MDEADAISTSIHGESIEADERRGGRFWAALGSPSRWRRAGTQWRAPSLAPATRFRERKGTPKRKRDFEARSATVRRSVSPLRFPFYGYGELLVALV